MTVDRAYVAARCLLLDALESLHAHRDALVVVGAQAVYLRTGEADFGVAPFTTDSDIVIDPASLDPGVPLGAALRPNFKLRGEPAVAGGDESDQRTGEPGIWEPRDGAQQAGPLSVDLIVPEGVAPPGGTRAARLAPEHGRNVARKTAGLEPALVDYDVMTVAALDETDQRRMDCRVAGPVALLIAKAFKIQDRLDDAGRPHRVADKDAGDVFRLMQTTSPADANERITRLLADARSAQPCRRGLELLRRQFGAPRGDGLEMAIRSLRLHIPDGRVRTVCVRFVEELNGD